MQCTDFPLLQSQADIFWAWKADPSSTGYNLPAVLTFPKTFGAGRLRSALQLVIASREALRILFVMAGDGEPRQLVDSGLQIAVPLRRLSEADARAYIAGGFVRPFHLLDGSALCRFELIETPANVYLLLDLHHSIADGYTLARNLLRRDLAAAITTGSLPPDDHSVPMVREAARAEAASIGSAAYEQARQHFAEHFGGVEFLRFGNAESGAAGEAAVATASLPMDEVDGWCRGQGVSAACLFLAAFCLVAGRLKRTREVALFCLTHGRMRRQWLDAYGMFVRSVPVVVRVDGSWVVDDYLRHVGRSQRSSLRHSVYPASHFCRDLNVSPAVTFGFQGAQIGEVLQLGDEQIVGRQLPHGRVRNDLGCLVYAKNGQYEIRTDSSTALNSVATLSMVASAVRQCVLSLMRGSGQRRIADISLVGEADAQMLRQLGRGPTLEYSHRHNVCDLILHQARLTPGALAVADEQGEMTYGELDVFSANLSRELSTQGLAPRQFVCLLTGARIEFVACALAVWRAGGAYVPLDTQQPAARLSRQVAQTGARLLLTDRLWTADKSYGRSVTLVLGSRHLYIYTREETTANAELLTEKETACGHSARARLDSPPIDAAYMMFTSGSTGEPKGVVVTHGAVLNLVHFIVRRWRLKRECRICCHSYFAFDASVEDMFPVLTVGGSLHLVPEAARLDIAQLYHFICEHRITGGCFTTRLGLLLADYAPLPLKYICLGGERLTRRPATQARVLNTYGPTETTVDATWCEVPDVSPTGENTEGNADIPIGRPLDNMQAYVTDSEGQLLPRGAVGELCLAGPQLAWGYWQQPQLTAERFVESKFGEGRIYRTGDLVRWGDDGLLYFVGRADHQVKLNGYRVEPGEVEHALRRVEGVGEAVVVARRQNGCEQLCAYYSAVQPMGEQALRRALQQQLPPYMIPTCFVQVEQWPMLASGKIDTERLPLPLAEAQLADEPCLSEDEQQWCALFANVLQTDKVRPTDHFFQLGGTSVAVMQLVVEAERHGFALTYADVYRWPTPRLLCENMAHWGVEDVNRERGQGIAMRSTPVLLPEGAPQNAAILLTGATGLLGSHVLSELLADEECRVVCLVRSKDGLSGLERLRTTMDYYFSDTWRGGNQALSAALERQVQVVEGDLTKDDVFVHASGVAVSLVIHCAADVRHYAANDRLWAVNVDGTRRVVDFCVSRGCGLVHVSTASVLLPVFNEYVRTKAEGEKVVFEATERSALRAAIMRVGNLMPRISDGRYQPDAESNAMLAALRMLSQMGSFPENLCQVNLDFSPVDVVAQALVLLTRNKFVHKLCTNSDNAPSAVHNLFTICHSPWQNLGQVLRSYGSAQSVAAEKFAKQLAAMPDSRRKAALFGLWAMFGKAGQPAALSSAQPMLQMEQQAADTTQLLRDMKFVWPPLGDAFFDTLFATS